MGHVLPAYAFCPGAAPSPGQAAFHRSRAHSRVLIGGFGSGKSLAGGFEFMQMMLEFWQHRSRLCRRQKLRPWWYRYLCAAPNYDKIESGPWHIITQWLDAYAAENGHRLDDRQWISHPRKIRLVSGDIIMFPVAPGTFAGGEAAGAWYDEHDIPSNTNPVGGMQMLVSRFREHRAPYNFFIGTSTGRPGKTGLEAHFVEAVAKEQAENEHRAARGLDPRPLKHELFRVRTADNPAHRGTDYIERMSGVMSERQRRQLIDGESLPEEGIVYALEYDAAESMAWRWQRPRGRIGDIEGRVRLAIDWGGHYWCGLVDHYGRGAGEAGSLDDIDIVFDEVIETGCQVQVFLDAIAERLKAWGLSTRDVELVWSDNNPPEANYAAYRMFPGRVRHQRINSREDKAEGIECVRWRLASAERTARGRPVRRLLFAPGLRRSKEERGVLKSLERYRYRTVTLDGQLVVTPDLYNEQLWSHACDGLRYYCYGQYRWIRQQALQSVGQSLGAVA